MTRLGKPRRIEAEVGVLAVDDPALARPGEVAAALERELTRLPAPGGLHPTAGGPARNLSADLGHDVSARALGRAVAVALGEELGQ